MKRIYIYLTVMATLLIGGGKAMAQSVTIDGVVYSVSGDHAYVSGNNGVGDTVVVLGTVTINDVEYPVTEIGYRAFYRLTQVLSYTLPDGIISIGTEAFYDNYVLKTINLPSSIESIGHMAFGYNWDVQITELPANLTTLDTEAFRGCTSATFTKIPQGITHIPIGAFRGCSSLTSLEFPEGLTQIDNYAFEECTALTTINIPAEAVITYVGTDAFRNTQVVLPEENSIRYLGSVAYELTDRSLTEYVIKEGTTAIYSNLFDGCTNMTSITIPSSVVSIGEYAFSGCTSLPIENGIRYADCYAIEVTDKTLTEYSLKNNVRFLGNALFQDCSAMTSVNIPLGVTAISNNTFSGCSALTSLSLPESVTSIGGSAFANCSSLTSVNIPSGVTSISANTFTGCSSLTSVVLPDSITSIGASAFANCSSLTSLILPETVTSIGNQAFYLCISLASINIPSGVPTIGESTFYQCSSLTSMTLPASVTSIGNQAFCHCGELSTLTLSKKLTSIGTQAFQYCNKLQKIINYSNLQLTKGNTGYGYVACYAQQIINVDAIVDDYYYFDTDANGKHHLTYYEGTDSVLTLPSDYQGENYGIGDAAFSGKNKIVSIQLPEKLEFIGANAFNGCSSLTSINVPSGITAIGSYAFYGCSSLTSVIIPSGVTAIGDYTFYGCSSLLTLSLPEGLTSIGNYAFLGCSSLSSVNIPSGVTAIGDYAFDACLSLTSVIIPSGVRAIGNHTFYNCYSLTSLELPEGLTSIGSYAFYGCSSLTSVIIPSGVTAISDCTFYNCSSLLTISLPEGLTSIGRSAFYGCSSLKKLNIPATVSTFASDAVRYLGHTLETLEIGSNITIPSDFIYYNNTSNTITTVICHSDVPPTISNLPANSIFFVPEGCYNVYKEKYPNNIVVDGELNAANVNIIVPGTLGEEVLNQVGYLRELNCLTVSGILNDADWECIKNSLTNLIDLDMSGVDMKNFTGTGNTHLRSLVLPNNCKSVSGLEYYYNLATVVLPSGVEEIGRRCFYLCKALRDFQMPEMLKSIGTEAFWECENLQNLVFNDSLLSIGNNAFTGCNKLKRIKFNEGLSSVGSAAFYDCPSLETISIPSSITTISSQMFSHCTSLSVVELHDGITSIKDNAFEYCSTLSTFTVPQRVTAISSGMFRDCTSLRTVILHDNITSIGSSAFYNCGNLSSITLPGALRSCGSSAFLGTSLTEVICPAFFPPVTSGDMIGANSCTLYVPEWTLNRYKLASNWNLFNSVEPISGIYPGYISIYTEESLAIPAEGLAADYKPNLEVVRYDNSNVGRLTLRGEKAMPLSTFKMEQTRATGTMTSLVNYGTLTADSVVTEVSFSTNTWHYLTFPYDVKISDIATLGDWVIRRYDGASRARADFSSTWQNVPYDSILHAGEGYIWYSTNGNFTVPAIENDNRNLIFANDARYTQLKEHASATQANYGWNLIGNPYPCFYDTRFIEYGSPITVRSGNSYQAYSPVDDSYILSPLEAFFVQCSADNNIVGFEPEGRQTDNTVRTLTSAPKRTRAVSSDRSVFNLYLESGSYADHTRFVINESASLAYEIACDAAKFMSDDLAVQQLFTIEGDERMAINERPFANGEVALGTYFGKSGSYTVALDTRVTEMEAVLIDKFTGAETDLMTDSYTFTTEAGTFTDRFAIRMKRTGVVDAIEAAVAGKLEVTAEAGAISIMNAAAPVSIYNAAGALVTTMDGGDVTVEVAPGMYIVKVGDEIHKVSVIK